MRESSLKVLSRRRCLSRPDLGSFLNVPSNKDRNSNARVTKRPSNAWRPTMLKAQYNAHFDVLQLILRWRYFILFFDVLTQTILHIQNIDMLTYQRAKCSLMFYQPYSFTHDQFRNIAVWLSCKSGVLDIHIMYFLKKYVCVMSGIF